jgi:putative ubiquitin-RnfH superfamily antitoxin RatB of RatAB toxin-antitoxin module
MVIRITLVYAPQPREVHEEVLELAEGCTALQALRSSALARAVPDVLVNTPAMGVWGSKVPGSQVMRDQDRLELYRPLLVDPKEARRARFEAQGAGSAGLFARRRPGAKAGY